MQTNRKEALFTDTPNQVVISTLYLNNICDLSIQVKIFSTIEAVYKWLGISFNEQYLQSSFQLNNLVNCEYSNI